MNLDPRRPRSDRSRSSSNHHNQHYALSDSDTDNEQYHEHGKLKRLENGVLFSESMLSPATSVIAVQLLDLISILFTRATSIYTEWTRISSGRVTPSCITTDEVDGDKLLQSTEEVVVNESTNSSVNQLNLDYVWIHCWRPLLQATARLCVDVRRDVRTDALTYLQKALLSPTLHPLSGKQWEDCFDKVLFPLLSGFLESIAIEEALALNSRKANSITNNTGGNSNIGYGYHLHTVEFADPRMRAIPLLTKVYLQHLRPLYELDTFNSLWIRMLAYMESYMLASSSFDSLTDAVRESLKNVLLVMCTGTHDINPILIKDAPPGSSSGVLWELTEKHLSTFLPELLEQLFPSSPPDVNTNTTTPTLATPINILSTSTDTECVQDLSTSSVNENNQVASSPQSIDIKLADDVVHSDTVVVQQCLSHEIIDQPAESTRTAKTVPKTLTTANHNVSVIQNL
ncbi:unnamed protein product [Heterobilharzia americana]|nr:unnamed protein product [Heterobilharzia americana]